MAKIARISKSKETINVEIRAATIMLQDFESRVRQRLSQAITNQQIEQWDAPENEGLLLDRLETIAAKANKNENDLITIAAICAVLTNFVEEEEV
jgi:uncharacterized protein (UPF0305 family)